jgi:hypothetical protein
MGSFSESATSKWGTIITLAESTAVDLSSTADAQVSHYFD